MAFERGATRSGSDKQEAERIDQECHRGSEGSDRQAGREESYDGRDLGGPPRRRRPAALLSRDRPGSRA
jgi:hypothetical protein